MEAMATIPDNEIYFGGPDLPARRLRNVLAERIADVPSGGSIEWLTYYFRDRGLAKELLHAHHRGVKVTVTLEGRPRTVDANDTVKTMLAGPGGLGQGFRTRSMAGVPTFNGKPWKPHLHAKLYCFSHPRPRAYIGSFNPSGDEPETEPGIIREIGDQDRGHNVLVGISDPTLVAGLVANARRNHNNPNAMLYRFSPFANRKITGEDTQIFFWPRISPHPIKKFLMGIASGARIRVAASHIKGKSTAGVLIALARKRAAVEILADSSPRRIPAEIESMLIKAGISFRRVIHPEGLPMHNKFVLAEINDRRWVVFGSFNWTTRSYWLNHEIGAISTNPQVFDAFAERWQALEAQAG
jgi:phosphatidylserine/phosphatidylglycerophosphate/cardiolipin synthase-like enzyme